MRSSALRRAAIPAEAMKRLRRTVSFEGLALVTTLFLSAGFTNRDEVIGRSFLILNSPLDSPSGRVIFFLMVGLSADLGLNGRDEPRDGWGLGEGRDLNPVGRFPVARTLSP